MLTAAWLVAVGIGFLLLIRGSREAVADAAALARGSRLPPFFVGMTLVAIGTDLPEIANSIVASFTNNGDINVGDSVGSALTQFTLVLGLLPFIGGAIPIGAPGSREMRGHQLTTGLTALAVILLSGLIIDDHLGRLDAALLIAVWIVGSRLVFRVTRGDPQLPFVERAPARGPLLARLLFAVLAIGGGATLAVTGITELAQIWGVPEFLIAFFGVSIGTSLPELVVDVTALRRGEAGLAVGDVLGSSFIDATLSVGVGPLLHPTVVDGDLGRTGGLLTAGAAVMVALVLSRGGRLDRRGATLLLLTYAAAWPILL